MAVRVAGRGHDPGQALLGHAEEAVRVGSRLDAVDRDLNAAVGPVLEPDRHRQARGELAVDLALGRARADRAPGDRVGEELRRDRVEELAAGRQAKRDHVAHERARLAQALVDRERAVQVRVVDQALPADRRARLLEVAAHHDQQVVGQLVGDDLEPPRVVEPGRRVVDRARTDHDQQPVVLATQDRTDLLAPARDPDRVLAGQRQLLEQEGRRHQRSDALDAEVAGLGRLGQHWGSSWKRSLNKEAPPVFREGFRTSLARPQPRRALPRRAK